MPIALVKLPIGELVEWIGYQHQAHLGMIFIQTNNRGSVIWKGEYNPFGKIISTSVNSTLYPPIDRLYGMYKDWEATGLDDYYSGYCWYDTG